MGLLIRAALAGLERSRRGFTVIELMVALGILGALIAIALPTFGRLQLRARTGEVKVNLAALRTAEALFHAEHGRYAGASITPSVWAQRTEPTLFTGGGLSDFHRIGFLPEGHVYFQYAVRVDPTYGQSYTADAMADLDGDGVRQTWGYVHPDDDGRTVIPGSLGCNGVVVPSTPMATDTIGPCGSEDGATVF